MKKNRILRKLALLISFVMLITSAVNTTYGFIVISTDPVINIFTSDDVKVSDLTIDKTVEHPYGDGYSIPDNIGFDFKIELGSHYARAKLNTTAGEMTADENGTLTVTVKPGVTLGIDGLDEGTVVKVTEQETPHAGFTVKDGVSTKEITVGADGSASVEFINIYTPAEVRCENVTVKGIKILEGRDWQEGDTFSFKLEQQNGETWTELGTKTVTYSADNADFNKFDFSDIIESVTFDTVGTYTFRMTEIIGELDHMDYDETVNHFTVKVTDTDMDGNLEISDVTGSENSAVTEEDGTYTVSVTFNNTFVAPAIPDPEDITVNIEVNKTVTNTGKANVTPEGFEFVLENIASGEKTALDSDANGKAVFDLTFTKEDIGKTYTYKLSETNEGVSGITYDSDVYTIEAAITLNEDNTLNAEITLNGTAVEECIAEFENIAFEDDEKAPPTRDNTNLTFWLTMMIISGATFVTLIVCDRRKNIRV